MSTCRLSKYIKNSFLCLLNFVFKVSAIRIFNENPFLMSHVCLTKELVLFSCLINGFVSCFSRNCGIELFGSICSCNHMNYCVIPVISNLRNSDSKIVHECLPLTFRNICRTIHKPSIDKNDHISLRTSRS